MSRSDPGRFPTELDNILLTVEDVCVWLGVTSRLINTMVNCGRFPAPLVLSASDKITATTPVRWFRYEIEDWLVSAPRSVDNGYMESIITPERIRRFRARLPDGDMLLTVDEVCAWLSINRTTLYRYLKRAERPFPPPYGLETNIRQVNSGARFRKSEIEQWLREAPRKLRDNVKVPRGNR